MRTANGRLPRQATPTVAAIAAGVLLAPTGGWTFEAKDLMAFGVGPFVVRPKLTVIEGYNDNVFYDYREEQSAFITGVTPAVDIRLGRLDADRVFHLAYNFNQYWYHDIQSIDTAQAHNFSLTGTIKGDRLSSDTALSLGLMNTVYGGYEAFSQGATLGSYNIDRIVLGLNQSLQYRLGQKSSAYGRFSLSETDFRDALPVYDQNAWKLLGGFGYAVRPKVRALAEIYYGQTASNPNLSLSDLTPETLGYYIYTVKPPHLETVGGYAGAQLTFTTKLTGTLKVGYEQSSRAEWLGGEAVDVGAPVASVSLNSAFTERTSATLAYDRSTGASVQASGSVYTGDRFNLQLRQVLGTAHPWFITVGGTYALNEYEGRRLVPAYGSDFIGANFSVAYQPQPWLGASLSYRYSTRSTDSRGSAIDYSVNEVTLGISVGY